MFHYDYFCLAQVISVRLRGTSATFLHTRRLRVSHSAKNFQILASRYTVPEKRIIEIYSSQCIDKIWCSFFIKMYIVNGQRDICNVLRVEALISIRNEIHEVCKTLINQRRQHDVPKCSVCLYRLNFICTL